VNDDIRIRLATGKLTKGSYWEGANNRTEVELDLEQFLGDGTLIALATS
jgi:hypothetical protein